MSQQYSLRWNNHQPNFISMFTTLLNTQTLVDVTLSADGKQLKAHKVVLSACSTYFQSLFVDNPSPHPIVILKDVSYADLRTMVDFMYYGEVNVTEEQLPKVLDTAKHLKIKGLTEMPESTSLMRSQGTSVDFQSPGDSGDSQRHSASPAMSPSTKRKRRRKSSTGSTSVNVLPDENRSCEDAGPSVDLVRGPGETITLSSVPQQRRSRDYNEDRTTENNQQPTEPQNLNMDHLAMEANQSGMQQGICNPPTGLKFRRAKHFQRQSRVQPDDRELIKQASLPAPSSASRQLQKHGSYPQYLAKNHYSPTQNELGAALLIRAVTVVDQLSPAKTTSTSTSIQTVVTSTTASQHLRASHTPAVRSGPPLSCNFCWNSVDESGRILRRKTQYHCPECRTNLCIVPCFHQYHSMPQFDATASAK